MKLGRKGEKSRERRKEGRKMCRKKGTKGKKDLSVKDGKEGGNA